MNPSRPDVIDGLVKMERQRRRDVFGGDLEEALQQLRHHIDIACELLAAEDLNLTTHCVCRYIDKASNGQTTMVADFESYLERKRLKQS